MFTRHITLVDLLERSIATDPLDAPIVQLEADIMADDMERYAPSAQEPAYSRPVRLTNFQVLPTSRTSQV